ncbi:hypothetical protein [Marinilabilia salmonicolor]|uniref:hypothetical protein n=1 Tax=Marinilabilia salmonicolor TaxID=989 RepID=UPI00029A209D|nr:hypothetical protein [Marinilabilia salmonicolor]
MTLTISNQVKIWISKLFETKRMLGNFPQAYSHLALIDTAMLLAGGEISSEEKILGNIG